MLEAARILRGTHHATLDPIIRISVNKGGIIAADRRPTAFIVICVSTFRSSLSRGESAAIISFDFSEHALL